MKLGALAAGIGLVAACHSAGPYGHAANYAPADDETRALTGSREYDPIMYTRQPEEWRKATVSLFGVVESRAPGPGGAAMIKLSVRRLEPRNLCENERDEDTCRVTVSDKPFGVVFALVVLKGDDDTGPKSVGASSLLRIIGTIGQEAGADGAPIVHATYARHWPAYSYVTKAAAGDMRQ